MNIPTHSIIHPIQEEIIGNEQVMERLRNIIKNRHLANAYIFSGPEGIGKRITAIKFAQALLCDRGDSTPCMTCKNCTRVVKHSHPNFMLIKRENYKDDNGNPYKNIPIEAIRDIEHYIQIKPVESKITTVVVDNAHELSSNAMNAMLKTLEEPPKYAVIILVTHNPSALLPTIHSRCQSIMFHPIRDEELKRYLKNSVNADDTAIDITVALSCGKIGRAISLLHSGLTEYIATLNNIQDYLSSGQIYKLREMLMQKDKHNTERDSAKIVLELMLLTIRDIILYKELQSTQKPIIANERLLTHFSNTDGCEMITVAEEILTMQRYLELNANTKLTFDAAMLQLVTDDTSYNKDDHNE